MPFTCCVYVKGTNSPWNKAQNPGLRSVSALLPISMQDPFSANGKAFLFPQEQELTAPEELGSRVLLL